MLSAVCVAVEHAAKLMAHRFSQSENMFNCLALNTVHIACMVRIFKEHEIYKRYNNTLICAGWLIVTAFIYTIALRTKTKRTHTAGLAPILAPVLPYGFFSSSFFVLLCDRYKC